MPTDRSQNRKELKQAQKELERAMIRLVYALYPYVDLDMEWKPIIEGLITGLDLLQVTLTKVIDEFI